MRAHFFFQSFLYTYSKVSNKSFGCLFEIFMACNASVNSRCTNAPLGQMINPFAPGDFAKKRVLKLVEWFSGHCRAIKS